jgi:hypothetical protein
MKTKQLLFLMIAIVTATVSTASFAQVKIGLNPTVINPNANLEVEAATTGRKMMVNKTSGQVTIADGTEGDGKVFTSNASGDGSWKIHKTTEVFSFGQTAGVVMAIPGSASFVRCNFPLSTPPPACARDLNIGGSFTIVNPDNDVVVDFLGMWASVSSGVLDMKFLLYIDKTTPGVFELTDVYTTITDASTACTAQSFTYRALFKDLPSRTYNVKMYLAAYTHLGSTQAQFAVGGDASPICGSRMPNRPLTITVIQ